ncbi:hypothetical protein ABTN08_19740, partial [Acinetobacter baumannii]
LFVSWDASADPIAPSEPAASPPATPPVVVPVYRLAEGQHFQVDPVVDGVTIGAGVGFTTMLELILATGEIKPQVVSPGDSSKLLSFD